MKPYGLVLAVALAGCAKLPDTGAATRSTRLVLTVTMEGPVNPNYVYVFGFRPSTEANPTTQGPVPVVAPPWGNGFVAGNCTYFVRWDPLQSPRYLVYRFNDEAMTAYFPTGAPINAIDVPDNGRQFRFELDLNQLALTPADAALLQSVQVNFFTQDRLPQGSSGNKNWDALGDGRLPSQINEYLTLDVKRNGLFTNERSGNLEPTGDAVDPSLDIADWSVEVRIQ